MRTQQLSLFIQLQRCSSYQASLYLRLITSKKFHSSTSVMYSNFNDDYMYSGTSSRPSTFRGHWNRGQPAYEEPESYDTSRFMRNEDKPLSPRRPNYSQRSPLWRNTPSPPPTPLPSGPSPEYISISEEELRPVDPNEQRKLLILDLNGALLWRKDRRVPYPRPYMPSFRAYLFAEETRKWLDVMVWSSAQPHNVEMMVRRCFYDSRCGYNPEEANPEAGKWEGLLVDVWARDRLGLSRLDYCTPFIPHNLHKPLRHLSLCSSLRSSTRSRNQPASLRRPKICPSHGHYSKRLNNILHIPHYFLTTLQRKYGFNHITTYVFQSTMRNVETEICKLRLRRFWKRSIMEFVVNPLTV